MRRVAYVNTEGEVVELAPGAAERALARDPELEREWERWSAMTGRKDGRLLVLDAVRVRIPRTQGGAESA